MESIGKLRILQSNAGYYIGRTIYDHTIEFDMPYSRESGYYGTWEEAHQDLLKIGNGEIHPSDLRQATENSYMYMTNPHLTIEIDKGVE